MSLLVPVFRFAVMPPVLFLLYPLKVKFSPLSYKPVQCAFDDNCIQTNPTWSMFPPPFPESYSFGEHSGNKEEREDKGISAHVRPRQRWSQMRASLLHTCGRERDGSQSLWRQLENSPEPRLIESLSSSLWASWAVGGGGGWEGRCSCTATGMRPGISSWQRLRRRRSVLRSRCEVELGPSRWRSVWDLSARDHVCEFLVRVGKCLQSSELIEYSVYQVYVHVPGLCCAANAAPMEGPDADTAAATGRERKKASNRMGRKDERGKEQRYRRVLKKKKNKGVSWRRKNKALFFWAKVPFMVHQQVAVV